MDSHNLVDYDTEREQFTWDETYAEADWDAPTELTIGHEVESSLGEDQTVTDSAVVPKPHSEGGNIVNAFVVPSERVDPSEALKQESKNHVKEELSAYEYPREIAVRDELSKTVTGKIRHTELQDEAEEEADSPA